MTIDGGRGSVAWLAACSILLAAVAPSAAADLDATMKQLAEKAASGGTVVWYESSPKAMGDKTVAAFNKRFPNVKVEQVRDIGGISMSARIIQEAQGNTHGADVATNGYSVIMPLVDRGLVEKVDWAALGLDPKLAPTPYAVISTAATGVFLYNTNLVKDSEAPKTWDDLVDPKWTGKVGTWIQAGNQIGSLAAVWGAERTYAYMHRLNAIKPLLFKSNFTLGQQVAAGEVPIGQGLYHATLPVIQRGAPVKIIVPDPVPVTSLLTFVPTTSRNKEGAKLFALWLGTPEGALAYEEATGRGNPMVKETNTAKLIAGKTVSEWSPSQMKTLVEVVDRVNKLAQEGGKTVN